MITASADNPLAMGDVVRAELAEAMRRGYVAAFRWLGNGDESRDACQEAAARALAAGSRFDSSQPFYPWFYRILRNHCVDELKARRRRVREPSERNRPTEAAPPLASPPGAADGQLVAAERARAVTRAMESMPEELREILELRHFQEASYEEIALIVGCPVGTVMSRLYRARKVLRDKLLADPDFGPASPMGGPCR